jgi:hypothetical protein
MKRGNTKIAFDVIKKLRQNVTPKQRNIADEEGRLLSDMESIKTRWRQYTEELYGDREEDEEEERKHKEADNRERTAPILVDEVRDAIKRLKKGKATGIDDLPAELWKVDSDEIAAVFCKLCNKILETEEWPEDWTKSIFVAIPKVKGTIKCEEHRTIALISHASKIMLRVLLGRMQKTTDEELSDVQMGFRKGVGTRDQIFNLRIIMEKAREHQMPLYIAFIDYKKAFDSVKHKKLWTVLKEMGVDSQVVKVLKSLYDNQQAAVRIDKETTEWFRIGKGVRQGCLISPLSFNGYSEKVMRESADILSWIGVTVSGRTINNLRYADDIVLVATSKEALQQLMDRVNETSKKYGLEINTKKTKVMVVSRNRERIVITCNGGVLEQVESFRYLGAIVEENGDGGREIRARLGNARTTMGSLTALWKDRTLGNGLKLRLMESLVWPVALYGCETWTLRKEDKRRISAFEMTTYRKMLRVSWKEFRTNESILEELQPKRRLMEVVKGRKLNYFGHMIRADKLPAFICQGYLDGKRARGRPKRRWMDDVEDWMGMTMADCVRSARNRERWRKMTSSTLITDPQQ